MKNLKAILIIICSLTAGSFAATAQQEVVKPKIAENTNPADQDKLQPPKPVPMPNAGMEAKIEAEAPKPIIPGGNFKPVETANDAAAERKKAIAPKAMTPVLQVTPAAPPENKATQKTVPILQKQQ